MGFENFENNVLCAANSYKQKYYINPKFEILPDNIKLELKSLCVEYANQCGGIISLEFDNEKLIIKTIADDYDFYFDEIESKLMISRIQNEKEELFRKLELLNLSLKLKDR